MSVRFAKLQHTEAIEFSGRRIRVARYLTALPPRKVLEQRVRQAMELERAGFAPQPRPSPGRQACG